MWHARRQGHGHIATFNAVLHNQLHCHEGLHAKMGEDNMCKFEVDPDDHSATAESSPKGSQMHQPGIQIRDQCRHGHMLQDNLTSSIVFYIWAAHSRYGVIYVAWLEVQQHLSSIVYACETETAYLSNLTWVGNGQCCVGCGPHRGACIRKVGLECEGAMCRY